MRAVINFSYTLIFLATAVFTVKKYMHMFQLNSYSIKEYCRWLMAHKFNLAETLVPVLFMIVDNLFFQNSLILLSLSGIAIAVIGCLNFEVKVKKPLVYTSRVIRMFATLVILLTISNVFLQIQLDSIFLLMPLTIAVIPFAIILANAVNNPMENVIKQYYIQDAKKILRMADTMRVIGITGSFGKTSVKYFLFSILRAKFDVLMTPGNYNTTMGVVKTIREYYSPTNQLFVCEMGARHIGDIKEICDIVHPDVGVITAIGPQHLETFRSLENIKRTKYELADSLSENAPLFLNGDDENVMSFPHKDSAIIYGIDNKKGYFADNICISDHGTSFIIHTPDGETANFSTKLLGKHNVLNIVGASAVAHYFGVPLTLIGSRVKRLEVVPHRLQLLKSYDSVIIDDAYNSNPQGAKAALEVLSMFNGMKILITPGMIELGEQEDNYNFQFGQQASTICDYIILVGDQQTKAIQSGVFSTQFSPQRVIVAKDIDIAMKIARDLTSSQKKYILLENDLPDNY